MTKDFNNFTKFMALDHHDHGWAQDEDQRRSSSHRIWNPWFLLFGAGFSAGLGSIHSRYPLFLVAFS